MKVLAIIDIVDSGVYGIMMFSVLSDLARGLSYFVDIEMFCS